MPMPAGFLGRTCRQLVAVPAEWLDHRFPPDHGMNKRPCPGRLKALYGLAPIVAPAGDF